MVDTAKNLVINSLDKHADKVKEFDKITKALGAPDIKSVVQNFDFSKMNQTDKKENSYLTAKLAPSYGTLTSEAVKAMDEHLKIIIAGTTNALAKVTDKSWENIVSTLQQNTLIEPMDDGLETSDKLIKDYGTSAFKTDGSPDQTIVKEVTVWFKNLIKDQDVLDATSIDIKVLGQIVAQTGATVDSFEAFFGKHEYHERTMIDIGVLRYPDVSNPFFKVYRIKLTAWSDCRRVLFVQEDKNGITGEYNVRRYKPRKEVLDELKPAIVQKAVQQAEDYFS